MQKLVFTNGGGQTIDLTSGNFGITNWEGLSGVGLNIQTQQVPFQDGGVFLDALMEQREISVTVAIQDNNDLSARYERKRQLISALNPKLGEGVLVYTNDYLSRQIKAVPQLPIFENKNSNDAGTLKANVVFSCPSPYWEDLEDTVVELTAGDTIDVLNEGDVPSQVEIRLQNASNVLVQNLTNKKLLKVVDLPSQKNIIINTNSGQKTVEENLTVFKSVYGNSRGLCEGGNGEIVQGVGSAIRVTENLLYNKEYSLQYSIGLIQYFNGYYYFNNFNTGEFYKTQDFKTLELAITVNAYYPPFFGIVNNKLFISGGGKLYYTENGTSWTEKTITDFNSFYGMTYWNGTYYICDYYHIYSTTDLENWTLKHTTQNQITDIEHNNVKLVAVGVGIIITSSNGSQWEEQSITQELRSITVKDNMFYTVGKNGSFLKSIAGAEWTDITSSTYSDITFTQIIHSSLWGLIINGGSGFIITFDGNKLSEYNMLGDCPLINIEKILKYKNGLFAEGSFAQLCYVNILVNGKWKSYKFPDYTIVSDILVTKDNNLLSSVKYRTGSTELGVYISQDDGDNFNRVLEHPLSSLQEGDDCIYGLYYDTETTSYKVFTSSDNGHNWVMEGTLSLSSIVQDIIYSEYYNKYFVLHLEDSTPTEYTYTLQSSNDGLNFTPVTTLVFHGIPSFNQKQLHCFGNEIVILGQTEVYQSFNGVNFAKQEIQWTDEIKDIEKQGKQYIAFDGAGNVLKFTDFAQIYSFTQTRHPLSLLIDNNDVYIGCDSGFIGMLAESQEKENLIANLSSDSDMSFNLELGNNIVISNTLGELTFRQKYIGV